jgi:Asp-tRNA(Asn)/Glu-tRNA(Gln) amidotransferase A subunit family amidase
MFSLTVNESLRPTADAPIFVRMVAAGAIPSGRIIMFLLGCASMPETPAAAAPATPGIRHGTPGGSSVQF